MTTQPTRTDPPSKPNRTYVTGSILILLGILSFAAQMVESPLLGMLILPGLGLIFIVWALLLRSFGLLIPGGILLGVGTGSMLAAGVPMDLGPYGGAAFMLAFGLGWTVITLLSPLTTNGFRWWPLIPGGILAGVGLLALAGEWGEQVLNLTNVAWPLILVGLGVYIMLKRTRSA